MDGIFKMEPWKQNHDKSFEQSELWAVFFVLFRGFVGDDVKLPSFLWGL